MVVNLRQRNTLQCLQAIFSQLSFQNFWLYLSGEVAGPKIIKDESRIF